MQKNSNNYIFRSVYQIDMKFDKHLRPATETSSVVSYGGTTIPRWRTAAILKIVISPYLSKNDPIFMKFCTQQQILNSVNVTWSKIIISKIQDGGRSPFWKSSYRHISAKNHPISMKFCTQQQILNFKNVTSSIMKKLHWTDSEFDRTYFMFSENFGSHFLFIVLRKSHI